VSVLRRTTYHIKPLHGAQLPGDYESLDLAQAACDAAGPEGTTYTIVTSVATIATTPHNYVSKAVPQTEAPPDQTTAAPPADATEAPDATAETTAKRVWRGPR
jgi:hypothetical protein